MEEEGKNEEEVAIVLKDLQQVRKVMVLQKCKEEKKRERKWISSLL